MEIRVHANNKEQQLSTIKNSGIVRKGIDSIKLYVTYSQWFCFVQLYVFV